MLPLLADLAEEQPLLCVVDDAHWLDKASAEALLFAARRLDAEGVVMLFAARDTYAPPFPAPGLDELRVGALSEAAARDLLAEHAADLPQHAHVQILDEAAGNPLALRELPVAQREGQFTTRRRSAGTRACSRRSPTASRACPLPPAPCFSSPRRRPPTTSR
ncbi:hypothetical protein AB0B50_02515 [Streptomyces sp. NPDC041068]|uniref:hypothetical protein n=1 Tax=Streptomyces sp. NPDC041068 TaxID=3155130 RepID=UPI0033D130E0